MKPLISVIIPVYKVEAYLDKCVSSVVNQTYDNLEIFLVVGDCGDNCPQMCRDWEQKDSRIKVIDRACNGLSDARNAGLEVMKGEYVAFIDSDDYIDERYLELLYAAIEQNQATVAVCGVHKVDENDKIFESHKVTDGDVTEVYTGREIFFKGTKGAWQYVTSWGKLFAAEIFKELRFAFKRFHEDEFAFPFVYYYEKCVACVPEQMYYYLQRSDSLMGDGYSAKDCKDYLDMWQERIDYFSQDDRVEMKSCVIQSYLAWDVLYVTLHAHQMSAEEQVILKSEIRKYFRWIFKKPYLNGFSDSVKLSVKCVFTLINTEILRKRYIK